MNGRVLLNLLPFCFALSCSAATIQQIAAITRPSTVQSSGPTFSGVFADMFIPFESGASGDALTTTPLDASTYGDGYGTWSIDTPNNKLGITNANSSLVAGVYALDVLYDGTGTRCVVCSYNTASTQQRFIRTLPVHMDHVSISYDMKIEGTGLADDNHWYTCCQLTASGGDFFSTSIADTSTGFQLGAENNTGDSSYTPIVTGTWYHVSKQFNRNATSYMNISDATTGALLASVSRAGQADDYVTLVQMGRTDAHPGAPAIVVYFDNLSIVYSNDGFPVGPAANTNAWSPTITSVSSGSPGGTTATITWLTTNALATSKVYYGTTTSYGSSATGSTATNHSVALSGLSTSTTYHYKVESAASGQTSQSSDGTFDTTSGSSLWINQAVNGDNWQNSATFSQSINNNSGVSKTIDKVVIKEIRALSTTQNVTVRCMSAVNNGGSQNNGDAVTSVAQSGTRSSYDFVWSSNNPVLANGATTYITILPANGVAEIEIGSSTTDVYAGGAFFRGATDMNEDITMEVWAHDTP